MKVDEIMVGDLVHDTMRHENKLVTPFDFEINPVNGVCYAETLLPIPLTHEVLVALGFEAEGIPDEMEYYLGTIKLIKLIGDDFYIADLFGQEYEFRYVHEVQHLLKVMHIDKKIII